MECRNPCFRPVKTGVLCRTAYFFRLLVKAGSEDVYKRQNYGSPVYGLISPVWEGLDVSWSEPTYEVEGVYFEKDEIEVFGG